MQAAFSPPGLVVPVPDLLEHHPAPDELTVREALSGNLCRCTGYEKVFDAVRLAAQRKQEGTW